MLCKIVTLLVTSLLPSLVVSEKGVPPTEVISLQVSEGEKKGDFFSPRALLENHNTTLVPRVRNSLAPYLLSEEEVTLNLSALYYFTFPEEYPYFLSVRVSPNGSLPAFATFDNVTALLHLRKSLLVKKRCPLWYALENKYGVAMHLLWVERAEARAIQAEEDEAEKATGEYLIIAAVGVGSFILGGIVKYSYWREEQKKKSQNNLKVLKAISQRKADKTI